MDWDRWYKQYDDSPSLQARLALVRQQIAAALDQCPPGPIRVVSLCAGDGRDLTSTLVGHPRRADVAAFLLDTHAQSLARGQQAAVTAGLDRHVEFRNADAGHAKSYAGMVPADLLIISGFLGHLRHAEAQRLIESLPMLLKPNGSVIWSRHQVMNDGRQQVPAIRALLQQASFQEVFFQTTAGDGFIVGRAQFFGNVAPLDPAKVFFALTSEGQPATNDAGPAFTALDPEQSIPACFERLAAEHPDRPAIGAGAWQPTYEQLNVAANRVAHGLICSDGGAGDRVALLLRHDTPLIVAILGVLKAGRVVVVLNATDPPARLAQLLDHAQPVAILTDAANRALADSIARGKMAIRQVEDYSNGTASNPNIPIDPGDLAWLIYTSGSTGVPKAVMQTHRIAIHNALRNAAGLHIRPEDRVVLLGSPSGGQGAGMIWCTLLHGATLCPFAIMEHGVAGLADWMVRNRISVFTASASVFRNIIAILDAAQRFPDVRIVRLASEPATFDDFTGYRRHFRDDCILLHTLSSSETGNITQCRIRHDDPVEAGRLPIGTPSEGIEILLLDEQGREQTNGQVGEVVVRSRYLSPGYWRNDALTAERFSPGDSPSDLRDYRTGDSACRTADGRLMFVGRKDGQVKIHGFRIELAEIEAALHRQPAVERVLVALDSSRGDEPQIAAYVVLRNGRTATAEALRTALRTELPGHMVPAAFCFMESFPLTAHGKVDRARLPVVSAPTARRGQSVQPPCDKVEKVLAGIWEAVLKIRAIGRNENFFDLGGNSLQAMAIVARIEEQFGQLPPLSLFLDAGTVEEQAAALCGPCGQSKSTMVPLRPGSDRPPLYCVHGAGGEVFCFTGLIRHLDPAQPAFGLQSPGMLGEWPPATIEKFAQRQVREILQRDPVGPCMLTGHCVGGLLALEIAQRLTAAGKPVQLVAIIDAPMPRMTLSYRSSSFRRRVTDWWAQRFRAFRWRTLVADEESGGRPALRFGAPYRRFVDHAFKDALRRYDPKPYAGRVVAFFADDPALWSRCDAREKLIRDYMPHAEIVAIPGSHEDCLRAPHVEALGRALQERIDRAAGAGCGGQDSGSFTGAGCKPANVAATATANK